MAATAQPINGAGRADDSGIAAAKERFQQDADQDRAAVERLLKFKQNDAFQFNVTAADCQSVLLDQAVGLLNLISTACLDADTRQREIDRGLNVEQAMTSELYPVHLAQGLGGVSTLLSLAKFMEGGR